jgi:acetyltransferase-like isoleucine patch superfamily enzyme
VRKLIESIVGRMKGEHGYKLDPGYSSRQLLTIIYNRGRQYLRGWWLKRWISAEGAVFAGKQVRIEHGYLVKAGRSLILEDGVSIQALSRNGVVLGNRVTIAKGAILTCTGVIAEMGTGIVIGDHSAVGAQSFLGGQGGIHIGSDVIMGPQVRIFSENHNYHDATRLIRLQGQSRKGVRIGNNCWLGAGVTILDGVSIGNGCVVAAGSVVTQSVPDNSVVMGVPARVTKSRP